VVRLPQQSQALAGSTTTRLCDLPAATRSQGIAELGACLTLVSPSGLTAEDRKEWLAVAMKTLSGIPADLLQMGCEYARLHCKFPSEIVPTIMERVGKAWAWRKQDAARAADTPRLEAPKECVDPKLIRDLIRSIGNG
jgi:hypothetical protein